MKANELTILFLSCDKYADLWKPLFYCFRKYWKNCPYPLALGSNTISFEDKTIKTILSGPDADWSSSLRAILKQIDTPYVFLWLDDIFPIETIDARQFTDTLEFMKRTGAKHVHVEPKPAPDAVTAGGTFGVYKRGAPYRAITFGFWETSYLPHLLLPGETPWSFEIMGSYRTSYMDGFYCSMKNIIPRIHIVEKGKIFQESYEYCRRHGIPLSSARETLSNAFHWKSELQKYYFNAMIRVPWNIRLGTMNILRKLLISY